MPVNIRLETGRLNKYLLCLQGSYNLSQGAKANRQLQYDVVLQLRCQPGNQGSIAKIDISWVQGLGNSSLMKWHLIWVRASWRGGELITFIHQRHHMKMLAGAQKVLGCILGKTSTCVWLKHSVLSEQQRESLETYETLENQGLWVFLNC